ncbi:unnamed protein product [Rotaria sp. Silwood1]|nr:unnamed protein product [Rotaria sp. Silwood1]
MLTQEQIQNYEKNGYLVIEQLITHDDCKKLKESIKQLIDKWNPESDTSCIFSTTEADGHFILRIIGTNASELVATRIIHELFQLCCEKRFIPNRVEKLEIPPRVTLYKYLVITKEGQPPPPPQQQLQQPKTPNYETRTKTNPFAAHASVAPSAFTSISQQPPEIKRRTSHQPSQLVNQPRARSDTLPFFDQTEALQHLSTTRSGNGSISSRRAQYSSHHEEHEEQEGQ